MNFLIPLQVKKAIQILNDNGFEAYIVGGCVRDFLLNLTPSDFDITTSALPEEILSTFSDYKTIETGLKHGTVTVVIESMHLEITTYRVDGEYKNNRHPDEVFFTRNLKEDLKRRDFTVNAMAYHPQEGLIDCFNGQDDLRNKIIRCVGEPEKRFTEDALRILRAMRFASVLGFNVEEKTFDAACKLKQLINNISSERINSELNKLLLGESCLEILNNFKEIIFEFIPELKPLDGFSQNNIFHIYDMYMHTLVSVASCPENIILRLTMLFHDIGKPDTYTEDENGIGHCYGHAKISEEKARIILRRLKYDNHTISTVTTLIRYHDADIALTEKAVKRWLNKTGEENFRLLLEVKRADTRALSEHIIEERLKYFDEILLILKKINEENQCFSLKDLAVNGKDVIEKTGSKGAETGIILKMLLNKVMENELENDVTSLLNYAKTIDLSRLL
ncbi:MAG: HD domain-containing protein [Clostridia bacterium]|nr:HD domain-containing protein [Clostridia bacterium]